MMQATQTEIKERPILFKGEMVSAIRGKLKTQTRRIEKIGKPCPAGKKGDRLWVRETFRNIGDYIVYAADFSEPSNWKPWTPSIFMPRYASRLTLEVTDIRLERLQDITEEDAIAEGCLDVKDFEALWLSINGHNSWDKNPSVWAIKFSVIED
ncbi:hypothetical protein PN499_26660 [Kamptonema animale CS-326]|jgi:hypothetical protein|uniref:hypothetical protein n=1 Tax=Kamptonema animale TaxID=92934 RepID=UPI00233009B6|nr:hypothetical protein [Kamptonema animale]MDB9514790.1 hypothetical protein [Kamptonema animale CS-326]